LVVIIAEHSHIALVLASWIREAELCKQTIPINLLISGTENTLIATNDVIQQLAVERKLCVRIDDLSEVRGEVDVKPPSRRQHIVCSTEGGRTDLTVMFARVGMRQEGQQPSDRGVSRGASSLSAALESAGRRANSSDRAFDYLLLQGAGYSVCPGASLRATQHVLALRRDFSLVRCGWGASCALVHARDAGFWARVLQPAESDAHAQSLLYHHSQALHAESFQRFGDAGLLVTRTPLVHTAEPAAEAPGSSRGSQRGCDSPLTAEVGGHEDEAYLESSGCIAPLDELSPCADPHKAVEVLQRPRWFASPLLQQGGASPAPAEGLGLSVQVLANDRPGPLFRTLSRLLEQGRPECITVHVDGAEGGGAASAGQRAVRRVVWRFAEEYGVRWLENPPTLHPALARALGFRHGCDGIAFPVVLLRHATLFCPPQIHIHIVYAAAAAPIPFFLCPINPSPPSGSGGTGRRRSTGRAGCRTRTGWCT
jgi:hypothetical protein